MEYYILFVSNATFKPSTPNPSFSLIYLQEIYVLLM
jgi:hypothetical protein